MGTTTRLGLPFPEGTDAPEGDNQIEALAEGLDTAALITTGVIASRPTAAAAKIGNFYYATDSGSLSMSTGTVWIEISTGGGWAPIGSSLDWFDDAAPADTRWLLCNGQAISRSTYSVLFALFGTSYGVGDGSTTFNLPDVRGRTTVGPDNMGGIGAAGRLTTNNTLGASGGVEAHTLSLAEMPAHAHGLGTLANVSAGSHSHSAVTGSGGSHTHTGTTGGESADHIHFAGAANSTFFAGGAFPINFIDSGLGNSRATSGRNAGHTHSFTTAASSTHTHTISTDGSHTHTFTGALASTGSGSSHTNLSPYLVANKIIRVL